MDLYRSIADHADRIPPTLSYSRAQNNNHLVSEAVGLYTAGALLQQHPRSHKWKRIGLKYFNLLHLNDSEVPLGSKKDRHARLGSGYIWKDDFKPLIYLLNKCKDHDIPMILETHHIDMMTLESLQSINNI